MKFFISIFLFSVQFVFIFCDIAFDYCSLNDNVCEGIPHIGCGTLETKLEKGIITLISDQSNNSVEQLSDDEKNTMLNFINSERNKIALGQTVLSKRSNLPKTVWDDELELLAKALAEIKTFRVDHKFCYRRSNGQIVYGQMIDTKSITREYAIKEITNPNHDIVDVSEIDILKEVAFISKMGCYFRHETVQNYYRIYQGGLSCVFDYGAELSAADDLYVEGVPCSTCKNGVGCDSVFTGLCA